MGSEMCIRDSPEDKPADDKPTEDKPADDKPTQDKPADAEEKPADDKPAEDKSADDKSAEDKPADKPEENGCEVVADVQEGDAQEGDAQAAVPQDAPAAKPAADQVAQPAPAEEPAAPKVETEEELKDRLSVVQGDITKSNQRLLDARTEKMNAARKKVQQLNARFADWYYLIDEASFKQLMLKRDALVGPKSATPPAAPGAGAPDFGGPGGLPAFPGLPTGSP